MATGITIKRYNGTTWDELAPKTTIEQVSGLSNTLSSIMEVAEGKTKTFVTTLVEYSSKYYILASSAGSFSVGDTITRTTSGITALEFNVANGGLPASSLNDYSEWFCVETTSTSGSYKITAVIDLVGATVAVGDVLLITQTDVPDYWFTDTSGKSVSVLETTKVDLSGYANVQANWTETNSSSDAYIKNKPSLATVATSGSYNDLSNKPTIPTVNNATFKIQGAGTDAVSFTANSSTNTTLNIKGGGNTTVSRSADGEITISSSDQYTGTVTGSSLTSNKVILGNGSSAIKVSSYELASSSTNWSTTSDTYIPTMKSITSYVTGLGYTTNTGTVTSVGITTTANNGLSVSGTVTTSGNLTVGFASNHSSVLYADSEPSNKVSGQILFEY